MLRVSKALPKFTTKHLNELIARGFITNNNRDIFNILHIYKSLAETARACGVSRQWVHQVRNRVIRSLARLERLEAKKGG